jgi:hypothetical protein
VCAVYKRLTSKITWLLGQCNKDRKWIFTEKKMIGSKKGNCTMTRGLIHQEDPATLGVQALKMRLHDVQIHKELEGEGDTAICTAPGRDWAPSLPHQDVGKRIHHQQMDAACICRAPCLAEQSTNTSQVHMERFPRQTTLGSFKNLKFKRTESQTVLSEHRN